MNDQDNYQLEGLIFAIIIVLELPPKESCTQERENVMIKSSGLVDHN